VAETRHVMGMPVTVFAPSSPVGHSLEAVFAWLHWADATFSPFRADSQISRIERGELAVSDAHPLVREVLARCDALHRETGGYFDARHSGALDPSGLVKGWAVDRAAALFGGSRLCIDAGGDVLVRGGGWRVGIRHPRERELLAATLHADRLAVATSGTYERGEHIVDPYTGGPPAGVLSVTVVGPDLATADACATAAFAMGEDGPAWTARLRGYEAMTILATDEVLTTPGFLRYCPCGSVAASIGTWVNARTDVRNGIGRSRAERPRIGTGPGSPIGRGRVLKRRCSSERVGSNPTPGTRR
jgi:FAD:protein FMN transferase